MRIARPAPSFVPKHLTSDNRTTCGAEIRSTRAKSQNIVPVHKFKLAGKKLSLLNLDDPIVGPVVRVTQSRKDVLDLGRQRECLFISLYSDLFLELPHITSSLAGSSQSCPFQWLKHAQGIASVVCFIPPVSLSELVGTDIGARSGKL